MADAKLSRRDFYVYVLFRPDTGEPFYVGKGCGFRWRTHFNAKCMARDRNKHKVAIVALYQSAGLDIPVIKIAQNLGESSAIKIEADFIKAIGRLPAGPLVNMTDGGLGTAGYKLSPEHVEKIRALHRRPKTEREKELFRRALIGRKRPRDVVERSSAANRAMGRKLSLAHRQAIIAANTGKFYSVETRAKISAAHKGHSRGKGRVVSSETRETIAKKARERWARWKSEGR